MSSEKPTIHVCFDIDRELWNTFQIQTLKKRTKAAKRLREFIKKEVNAE